MGNSFYTIGVVNLLLRPVDSQIIRALFEKAPDKKGIVVPQKVSASLKEKIIDKLTSQNNIAYLVSEIKKGKLDRFYIKNDTKTLSEDFTLVELQKELQDESPLVGSLFLNLIKQHNEKDIKLFFKNKLSNLESLSDSWNLIDWNDGNVETDVLSEADLNILKSELTMAKKANSKLKGKLKKVLEEQNKHDVEIKEKYEEKIISIKEQYENKNKEINSLMQEKLEQEQTKYAEDLIRIQDKDSLNEERILKRKNRDLQTMKIENYELEDKLKHLTNRDESLKSVIFNISHSKNHKITLVVEKQMNFVKEKGMIFIGIPDNIKEVMEWVELINPDNIVLFQEITTQEFSFSLKKEIYKNKMNIPVDILSKSEFISGGMQDDDKNAE